MKKHHEILADVNALRAQLNMKPLKDWKGSNADLLETRTTLRTKVKALEPKITNSQAEDVATLKARVTKLVKDNANKTASKSTDKAEGASDRFLGVAPKIARAKLRKAFGSDWKNKTAAEIAAVLKPTKG